MNLLKEQARERKILLDEPLEGNHTRYVNETLLQMRNGNKSTEKFSQEELSFVWQSVLFLCGIFIPVLTQRT